MTSSRRSETIDTSPFIPGMRSPSSLFSVTRTGNIVTFCWTIACGSIFSTTPRKGRSGKASTITVASRPARTEPMSVSFTSARARTRVRSAIFTIVVPPPTALVPDWMTCPSATGFSMIVPVTGAVTRASSSRCCARSSEARARTMADCALA